MDHDNLLLPQDIKVVPLGAGPGRRPPRSRGRRLSRRRLLGGRRSVRDRRGRLVGLCYGHIPVFDKRVYTLFSGDNKPLAGLDARLAIAALKSAIRERDPPKGCIHHSDRGSQFASADYRNLLTAHDLVGSMSRRGNPYDNAKAQSFMKRLKVEAVY
jgi:transposase InsO family protein